MKFIKDQLTKQTKDLYGFAVHHLTIEEKLKQLDAIEVFNDPPSDPTPKEEEKTDTIV